MVFETAADQIALAWIPIAIWEQRLLRCVARAPPYHRAPSLMPYRRGRQHEHRWGNPRKPSTGIDRDIYHFSEPSDSIPSLHLFQLTFSDFGGSGNRWAATRNMSGAGFPCFTSGSVEPITLWSNKSNNFGWPDILISAISLPELVAKQNGTPCSWRWSTKRSAPGNRSRLANRFRHNAENRSKNSLVVMGSPNSVTAILALICSVVPRIRIRTSRGYGFPWSLAMSRTIPS